MLNKIKRLFRTENFSYFIRYFAVFTLIFGLMTMINFQLMRLTMYQSSDENFKEFLDVFPWKLLVFDQYVKQILCGGLFVDVYGILRVLQQLKCRLLAHAGILHGHLDGVLVEQQVVLHAFRASVDRAGIPYRKIDLEHKASFNEGIFIGGTRLQ